MNQDNNQNINNNDNIEVVDLNTTSPQVSPNEEQKSSKSNIGLILIIFILIGLFIIFLPYIDSFLKNVDTFNYYSNSTSEPLELNLINGLILIDDESYMTVSDIKFYNFSKKSDNIININYISNKSISNIDSLNIYISLYNSTEELIYRTQMNNINDIVKDSVDIYKLSVNTDVYGTAKYAKVEQISKSILANTPETSLECIYDKTDDDVNLYYDIKYYFKLEGLIKYEVNKNILYLNETESETLSEYKQELTDEFDLVSNTNIKNIQKEDLLLSYTVNYEDFDSLDSDFTSLFEEGTIKSTIETEETSLGWECN